MANENKVPVSDVSKPDRLASLKSTGIPVKKAAFQNAVENGEGIPENQFSTKSNKASQHVEMLLIPQGLLCMQNGSTWIVPLANVKQAFFE